MTRRVTARRTPRCRKCGWVSKPMTPGRAAYARRRHKCERHLAQVAMAQRVAARKASEGPSRPCMHKVARHDHGTHARYVLDRCRCRRCRDARAAYEQRRSKDRAYGRPAYVDAAPAREHCHELMAAGVGLKQIAKLSGVAHGALWKLVYGKRRADGRQTPSRRIRPATAAAILALPISRASVAGGACVTSTTSRVCLQELVALGWSQQRLADRLGMLPTNFGSLLHDRGHVRKSTAERIQELYDELVDVAPPQETKSQRGSVTRAKRYAAERGWAPPAKRKLLADPRAIRQLPAQPRSTEPYAWLKRAVGAERGTLLDQSLLRSVS
jgi:transcriptional regulator with XRE-family HTH domain